MPTTKVLVADDHGVVRKGLRFHALRGINYQQRAFARGERTGDFVGEVNVAGGVDEIELLGLAVFGEIHHADGVGFDGDATLAFELHGIEDLLVTRHFTGAERSGDLQHTVRERGLAVVDMRDDREVPNRSAVHALLSKSKRPHELRGCAEVILHFTIWAGKAFSRENIGPVRSLTRFGEKLRWSGLGQRLTER